MKALMNRLSSYDVDIIGDANSLTSIKFLYMPVNDPC